MSVKRSPIKSNNTKSTPIKYGSDSSLHLTENTEQPENNITRRIKRRPDSDLSDCTHITMTELKSMLDDLQIKQEAKYDEIKCSMDAIMKQNDEIKASMVFLSEKYDNVLSNLKKTQEENINHKKYIKTLETQMEQFEKKSRASSVELRNIPKSETETKQNLIELTKSIGATINVPINDSDIRDIYRLKIKDKTNSPIIVDFNSIITKEKLIKSTIEYNKEKHADQRLNTTMLKIQGPPKPVYVAESLTKKVKYLYYLSRLYAKENKYESCWTSYGKVYLRCTKKDQRIWVESEEALETLKKGI